MHKLKVLLVTLVVSVSACVSKPNIQEETRQLRGQPIYLELGEWRLNDSRDRISSLKSLPNLKEVAVTGGLETQDGIFNGRTKNISFVFDDDGLAYSQIWLYEGSALEEAVHEFSSLHEYFQENLGGSKVKGFSVEGGMTTETIEVLVTQVFRNVAQGLTKTNESSERNVTFLLQLDMSPVNQPKNNRLHGAFVYSGIHNTFFVFLYEDRKNSPDRSASNHVELVQAKN